MKIYQKATLLRLCTCFALCTMMLSCAEVKEYQKAKINDSEMALSNRTIEKTTLSFQSYREGASGANAGKSGGGCGCN